VQPAHGDEGAPGAVAVGDLVGAPGGGDVGLDDDEVGIVVQIQRLHVLVLDDDVGSLIAVGGESGQAERREGGVLDRPEQRAGGLRQDRQDHLHAHASTIGSRCGEEVGALWRLRAIGTDDRATPSRPAQEEVWHENRVTHG
jgi:hypothetical protein